jgi:hypothetical protein
MVFICLGKQKVIWILKLKENGWKAAPSALRVNLLLFIIIS